MLIMDLVMTQPGCKTLSSISNINFNSRKDLTHLYYNKDNFTQLHKKCVLVWE